MSQYEHLTVLILENASDISNFAITLSDNEAKLLEAVATIGPIAVAIDASHKSFQMYSSGVYYERKCSSRSIDHGVGYRMFWCLCCADASKTHTIKI